MTYDPATYWPERYARQGPTYVAKGGRRDSYDAQIELIAPLFAAELPREGRVLDFGCGPQRFRPALEACGLVYEGFDLIPGLGTVGVVEPGRYDCAVAIYVLQHIVDEGEYADALGRIREGLRPGGVLLVVDALPTEYTEDRPRPAHMMPRGPQAVMAYMNSGAVRSLDAGHWTGTFVR